MRPFAFSAALVSACFAGRVLWAQPSPAAAIERTASCIALPLRVELEALFAEAEHLVPKVPPGVNTWAPVPEGGKPGLRWRFNLHREALSVRMNGPRLTLRTLVRYGMEVGLQVTGDSGKALGACGQGKEGLRQILLGTEADLAFTPDWGLEVHTSVLPFLAVNPCKLTALKEDLSAHVVGGMQEELVKASAGLGQQLSSSVDLRGRTEAAWNLLRQPVELAPGIHLAMNPEGVRLAPLVTEGQALVVTPGISVRPAISFGAKPAATRGSLPTLETSTAQLPPTFQIQLQAEVPVEEASRHLGHQVVGHGFKTEKGRCEITGAKVQTERGQAFIEVTLKGRYKGRLTLVGRPTVDLVTNTLHLRALDFTPESRAWILKNGESLSRSPLLELVEEEAAFRLNGNLLEARKQVRQHLNHPLAPGLLLRGELKGLYLEPPKVLADRFRVEGHLEGRLQAELTEPNEAVRATAH